MVAPALVLGTAQWGMPYGIANSSGPPDPDQVRQMLALALGAGRCTLDTARAYGRSEEVIGQVIADLPRADEIEVVTKVAADVVTDDDGPDGARDRAGASLRASLQALRRPHLDVLLLHRAGHRLALGGAVWDELRRARDSGLVGLIGASALDVTEAEALLLDPDVGAVQVAASVFDQRLLEVDFFSRARARGVRVFVRSVFLQGVVHLADDALPAHLAGLVPARARLARAAGAAGLDVGAAALLFARDRFGAELVVGCERPAQLEANLEVLARPRLDSQTLDDLGRCRPPADLALLDPWRWPPAQPRAGQPS